MKVWGCQALGFVSDMFFIFKKLVIDSHKCIIFGRERVGKSTLIDNIMRDSDYIKEVEKTEQCEGWEKANVDYIPEYESFRLDVADVGGERLWWSDTLRNVVGTKRASPNMLVFIIGGFRLDPKTNMVKRDEHLISTGQIDNFAIKKIFNGEKWVDYVYNTADRDAMEFITDLYFDYDKFVKKYPDVIQKCLGISPLLKKKKDKLKPKFVYFVVNHADILDTEDDFYEIMKPYEDLIKIYDENGIKVRQFSISAKYGHGVRDPLLKAISDDFNWNR